MIESYKRFWKGYTNWGGKSTRSEFWWVVLCHVIVVGILVTPMAILGIKGSDFQTSPSVILAIVFFILYIIYGFLILIPNISLSVRRLRDAGFHWALMFLVFIPLFGGIACFVLLQFPSKKSNGRQSSWHIDIHRSEVDE